MIEELVKILKPNFKEKERYIAYTPLKVTLEQYIRFSIQYSLLFSFLSIIIINIIFIVVINYYDLVLFLLSIIFGFIVFILAFLYFYFLPDISKFDYLKNLEDNFPYFVIYFYAYAGSGMNIIDIFRMINKRKQFGVINKEISYLLVLVDVFGNDPISAMIQLASVTPSKKLKTFLYGVVSVVRSGGSLSDYIKSLAKDAINDYEIQLKVYNEKANIWITLYSFFFVVFPITILILAFLFSYAYGSSSILSSLTFFFVVIIPLSYITFLYMIHIYQPKI